MSIVSISPHASNDPGSGHFYWMYRSIFEQKKGFEPSSFVIGPARADCEHVIGVLSDEARRYKFRVRPFFSYTHNWRKVESEVYRLLNLGAKSFQFYDGGLAELLIAFRFSWKCPNATFLYNFHWALEWVEILTTSRKDCQLLSAALRLALSLKPKNLILTAETKRLSALLESKRIRGVGVYPIWSPIRASPELTWDDRELDVLILPSNYSHAELENSLEFTEALGRKSLVAKFATRRETWEEFLSERRVSSIGEHKLTAEDAIFLPLPNKSYETLLKSARVVVLPYLDPYFMWGSSGKFSDAIACGAFPFVPDGTAIASQSTISPELHYLFLDNPSRNLDKISTRLESGFDHELSSPSLQDLSDLIGSGSRGSLGRLRLPRTELAFLWVASILFRPKSRGSVLQRLKNYLPSLIQSSLRGQSARALRRLLSKWTSWNRSTSG